MDQSKVLLELLNILFLNTVDNIATIDKETLTNVITYLKDSQDAI